MENIEHPWQTSSRLNVSNKPTDFNSDIIFLKKIMLM